MKKSHPPYKPNLEKLHEKVNKPRRAQHPQTPQVTSYVGINVAKRSNNRNQPEKTPHTAVHKGGMPLPPPGPNYMAAQLLKNGNVQYCAIEVQEWSRIVFGNIYALNKQLARIHENPRKAERILLDIVANPESSGPFAGRKVFGIKSPKRRKAEDNFVNLYAALERHVQTVQKVYNDLLYEQTRERDQERDRNPERAEHRAHHHAREQKRTAQGQDVQQCRASSSKEIAF